jgi:hypothetical protein
MKADGRSSDPANGLVPCLTENDLDPSVCITSISGSTTHTGCPLMSEPTSHAATYSYGFRGCQAASAFFLGDEQRSSVNWEDAIIPRALHGFTKFTHIPPIDPTVQFPRISPHIHTRSGTESQLDPRATGDWAAGVREKRRPSIPVHGTALSV